MQISFNENIISTLKNFAARLATERFVVFLSIFLAVLASMYSYMHGYTIAYGDAESHLNIAKRVIDSLTPGFAQLGGIWLPLPHLLMVPFVYSDFLWRTGLAGSIIGGLAFVISSLYIYKLGLLLTEQKSLGLVAAVVFMTNPNVLYLQSTPMTELPLIVFFILSTYYFIKFIKKTADMKALVLAAFFGFCATLSRYDGWFLVCVEAGVLGLLFLPWKKIPLKILDIKKQWSAKKFEMLEGTLILFVVLAFFGIVLWFAWGKIILGDPLYFTHSQFSAKSQQNAWLVRGELPAYHHILISLLYYFVTSMTNIGVLLFVMAIVGLIWYAIRGKDEHRFYILLLLVAPFIFNVVTLFLGQSVIFNPSITPNTFEWRLFNVRYGVMMVPLAALAIAYLFKQVRWQTKILLCGLIAAQLSLYTIGYAKVTTLEDGISGLSSFTAKIPDAQYWFAREYDSGLVLIDDYARSLSIIRTPVPMKNIIYVGNKPYWEESLKQPEKYATWIIMRKDDTVWANLFSDPGAQGHLYKYFIKVYTSPDTLIFKRNPFVEEE